MQLLGFAQRNSMRTTLGTLGLMVKSDEIWMHFIDKVQKWNARMQKKEEEEKKSMKKTQRANAQTMHI